MQVASISLTVSTRWSRRSIFMCLLAAQAALPIVAIGHRLRPPWADATFVAEILRRRGVALAAGAPGIQDGVPFLRAFAGLFAHGLFAETAWTKMLVAHLPACDGG